MITNYQVGHDAEKQAAEYLQSQGFVIRELNWRTRFCEIDVVAEKKNVIYFVEVKYRRNAAHGTGLEYITPRKLKQMHFAAQMWTQNNKWSGDSRLAGLAIDGQAFTLVEIV